MFSSFSGRVTGTDLQPGRQNTQAVTVGTPLFHSSDSYTSLMGWVWGGGRNDEAQCGHNTMFRRRSLFGKGVTLKRISSYLVALWNFISISCAKNVQKPSQNVNKTGNS